MAVSGIFIIAVIVKYVPEAGPPVAGVFIIVYHDCPHYFCILAFSRNIRETFFNDFPDVLLHKSIAYTYSNKNTAVNTISVMCHTGGLFRIFCCQIRISRCHKSPGINENLSAYLFCRCTSVLFDTSASRSRNPVSQIQIRCMLSRYPITAPPEKSVFKRRIIQKGLCHILCLQFVIMMSVFQCPQEKQRAVAVIIRSKFVVIYRIMV